MPDFAAAEAEAAAFSGDLDADDGLTMPAAARLDSIGDDLAAADGATADDSPPQGERATTRVVVLGLVSVASIATFKRSLGRVAGRLGHRRRVRPRRRVRLHRQPRRGRSPRATRSWPCRASRPGSPAETADGLEVTAHDPDAGD